MGWGQTLPQSRHGSAKRGGGGVSLCFLPPPLSPQAGWRGSAWLCFRPAGSVPALMHGQLGGLPPPRGSAASGPRTGGAPLPPETWEEPGGRLTASLMCSRQSQPGVPPCTPPAPLLTTPPPVPPVPAAAARAARTRTLPKPTGTGLVEGRAGMPVSGSAAGWGRGGRVGVPVGPWGSPCCIAQCRCACSGVMHWGGGGAQGSGAMNRGRKEQGRARRAQWPLGSGQRCLGPRGRAGRARHRAAPSLLTPFPSPLRAQVLGRTPLPLHPHAPRFLFPAARPCWDVKNVIYREITGPYLPFTATLRTTYL